MPRALDRCVKKVKARGGVKNPYAVCRASLGTNAQIRAKGRQKARGKK